MRSLRFRTTVLTTLVVALALLAAAVALVEMQRRSLTENIDTAITLRAGDLAGLLQDGGVPDAVTVGDDEVSAVQIVDGDGSVVAASANLSGVPPIDSAPGGTRETVIRQLKHLPINDETFRLLARTVDTPSGRYTIFVAGSLEPVGDSTETLQATLLLVFPALAGLVAAGTWFVVGRTLSPVEAIRREVSAISGADLARRVPEPATRDEIARLAATMNDMLARLEDAYERQQQFVADASHELRSPLATIRAELEVDLANPGEAAWAETAADVLAEVERLQRLVDDLLVVARSDAGALDRRNDALDLDDIVLREAGALRARGKVAVDTVAVSAGQVRGDPDQLARLVRNLLDNAERHAATLVTLSLSEDLTAVVLTVTDDGPGVPHEVAERIFERFARADTARDRVAGGTGLGLAIVRAIIEDHGGAIHLDSAYSPGARFVVTLPSAGA